MTQAEVAAANKTNGGTSTRSTTPVGGTSSPPGLFQESSTTNSSSASDDQDPKTVTRPQLSLGSSGASAGSSSQPDPTMNQEETKMIKKNDPKKPRLECQLCLKTYATLQTLKTHKARMHLSSKDVNNSEVNPPMFHCKYTNCTVALPHQGNLSRHIQTFHQNLRHPCKEDGCTQKYKSKYYLTIHKLRDHDNVRWKCNRCPQQCSTPQNLANHIKYHEKKDRIEQLSYDIGKKDGQLEVQEKNCEIIGKFN